MTTARTTTAQPIAASISIPDAILHSTAFARRKPLLLLKIVRQTDPRFSPASPGGAAAVRQTAQTAAQGPKSPSAQALAAPFRLRRESGTAERTPRQSRRPPAQERDGLPCRRRTALRKAFAPVRERKRPYGAHSFVLSGGSPAALCGGGTAGGLSAPTAFLHGSPHPSGLGIFSFAAAPCRTPAVLILPCISPPRVSFAAALGFPCSLRHFPPRQAMLCRMPRFSQRRSTAALCVPLAAHKISLCARPRFAVPDTFANRRSIVDGRTRRFLLRTPWPTVPAMPADAPPSPNAR